MKIHNKYCIEHLLKKTCLLKYSKLGNRLLIMFFVLIQMVVQLNQAPWNSATDRASDTGGQSYIPTDTFSGKLAALGGQSEAAESAANASDELATADGAAHAGVQLAASDCAAGDCAKLAAAYSAVDAGGQLAGCQSN